MTLILEASKYLNRAVYLEYRFEEHILALLTEKFSVLYRQKYWCTEYFFENIQSSIIHQWLGYMNTLRKINIQVLEFTGKTHSI